MTDFERFVKCLVRALIARDPLGVHRPISVEELRWQLLPYRTHRSSLGITSIEDYEMLVLRLVAEESEFVRTNPAGAADRVRQELVSPNPNLDLVDDLPDVTVQIGAPSLARIDAIVDEPAESASPSGLVFLAQTDPGEPAIDSEVEDNKQLKTTDTESQHADPIRGDSRWAKQEPVVPVPVPVVVAAHSPAPPPGPAASDPLTDLEIGPPFEALDLAAPSSAGGAEPEAGPRNCPGCQGALPARRVAIFCPFCGHQVGASRCASCGTDLEPGWRHCITCGGRTH